jgi:hypothetical protein
MSCFLTSGQDACRDHKPETWRLGCENVGHHCGANYVAGGFTTEVRGGHGGGGGFHRGGGFHGGAVFHGGGYRSGAAVHRGGGYRSAHVFRGGGYRYSGTRYGGYRFAHRHHHFHRHFYYGPSYYDYPYYSHHRRCRVIWTYYGPRRVCHFRHWRHRLYW